MVVQAWASKNSDYGKHSLFGKRHILVFMAFFGIALSYALRFNLSIIIVVMVNSTITQISEIDVDENEKKHMNNSHASTKNEAVYKCPSTKVSGNSSNNNSLLRSNTGSLNWDEATVGLVLGSFFWGYILTQIPGGFLAQRYGGKWPFGLAQLVSAIAGLLIPLSSYAGPYFLTTIRIIQGLFGGISIPASHVLISKWIPPNERGKYANFIYAGMPFGSAVTLLSSGFIAHFLGWETVCYVTGVVTIVWFVLWTLLIYESPSQHPTISDDEYKLIEFALIDQLNNNGKIRTPWKEIFKSVPMWAILICHPASTWGHYTLLILIPTYLKTALHFDLQSNSWISACPHITSWIMSMIIVKVGAMLHDRHIISIGTVRKINMIISLWGSAACMIGVAFAGCDYVLAVILLILAVGCIGGIYGGVLCNHIDIAPNFAGLLMGISNTLGTVPGFLSPNIAGYILQGNPSVGQWRKVFWLGAGVHILGNIAFILFASGEVQPWNNGAKSPSSKNIIDVKT